MKIKTSFANLGCILIYKAYNYTLQTNSPEEKSPQSPH